jgi:hypothetical protein
MKKLNLMKIWFILDGLKKFKIYLRIKILNKYWMEI